MDRLVKADTKEVEMIFLKGQKCSSSFKLTNLMHTMSVAVSLTTTNPSPQFPHSLLFLTHYNSLSPLINTLSPTLPTP